ncbi:MULTISPECIES: TrmH family RNA methyltransferase [Bacteria]|uniref:TrmH family RNA methyltransferase n=1 Tax=Bacteria TaxID=2 RepID=UPI003C79E8AD
MSREEPVPSAPVSTESARPHKDGEPVIDDPRHPLVRRVADVLRSAVSRPRTLIVDDEENIAQALASGVQLDALYAVPGVAAAEAEGLRARTPSTPLHLVADGVMRSLFKTEKRARLFALARAPRPTTWQDVAARDGDVVVLDGVRIAGNIGAIIRSARAFDAAGIVLVDSGLTTVFDRRLIRASRGLTFSIPILLATGAELAGHLRAAGIPLVGLAADGAAPLPAIAEAPERIALLMGSERTGASPELDALAERRYRVPMSEGVESLNVSVAAGIALYERSRPTT